MKNTSTPATPPPDLGSAGDTPLATTAGPRPPEPPLQGEPDKKELLRQAKAAAAHVAELTQTTLAQAREAIGFALRVMIGNGFPDNHGARLLAENAFEAAKLASAAGQKATRADISTAAIALANAEANLANCSLKFPADLARVREALQKIRTALKQIPEE